MVLELVSAFGVTASAVQFINFTAKLISKATESYKGSRSALVEAQELDLASARLMQLSNFQNSLLQKETVRRRRSPPTSLG